MLSKVENISLVREQEQKSAKGRGQLIRAERDSARHICVRPINHIRTLTLTLNEKDPVEDFEQKNDI